jgi:hypothetical protein
MQPNREIEIRTVTGGLRNEKRRMYFFGMCLLEVPRFSKTPTLSCQLDEIVSLATRSRLSNSLKPLR